MGPRDQRSEVVHANLASLGLHNSGMIACGWPASILLLLLLLLLLLSAEAHIIWSGQIYRRSIWLRRGATHGQLYFQVLSLAVAVLGTYSVLTSSVITHP